jgi:glycerol-3-phosphate dehydrogenase
MTNRRSVWQKLENEVYDLLIIGGGINGAGIARDATLRGLKVLLVEKNDFAAGTSSKSSKLIHGGLRYLQQAELGLVFESVSERTLLLKLAPHLVRPLEFLVPAYRGQFPGRIMLHGGLLLYDALAKFSAPGRHRAYRTKKLLEREPGLRTERLTGGVTYYDGATDDARLTLENALDARAQGADILTYTRVTSLLSGADKNGDGAQIEGAVLMDELDPSRSARVRARVTVNATGPWADQILSLLPGGPAGENEAPDGDGKPEQSAGLLRPTKGCHIVVAASRLPVRYAVVMTTPQDQRVVFAIPWRDPDVPEASRTIIGTTDTDFRGDPDEVFTDAADVEYLLACANHYFPDAKLASGDILATWAGLRPLVAPDGDGLSASQVSREHRLLSRPGLLTIIGGKLTTYRRMSAQVVEAAFEQLGRRAPPCPTGERPLPGAEGLLAAEPGVDPVDSIILALRALEHPAIDAQVARHLAMQYGVRGLEIGRQLQSYPPGDARAQRLDPELPFLLAEVDVAVLQEEAQRLDDVLSRRLPLLLLSRDQGLSCAERVADRMAELLGWTPEQRASELATYRRTVELSRRFR